MYSYLGILNLSFKEYLYLEATGRQEYTSTLAPDNNSYFYPSLNAGFVFTDAFTLPAFLSYGKIRASTAGIANGTHTPYLANVVYSQTTLQTSTNGPVTKLGASRFYGNLGLKPERKTENEIGLEARFLQNKFGFDVTYYDNVVRDQILDISLAQSTGASTVLSNLGKISSKGIEVGLNATPYANGSFRWDARLNYAKSTTTVDQLAPGMDEITFYNLDAGAVQIKAEEGEELGTIYIHPREQDANGNYVIGSDGLYRLSSEYKKVGTIQPKAAGGLSNTLTYKGFGLEFLMDYRFGGKLVSAPHLYATGAGMYENTMKYRDQSNGGLPYNIDENGNKILASDHTSAAYHDGVLLEGVTETGEANTTLVDAAYYYINSFYWASGRYEEAGVLDNDYIKMREVVLSYNLPKAISSKIKFQNVRVSLVGRNLFYVYRTLENLDPEVAVGSSWLRQGVDEGSMAATRSYGFAIHGTF
jgi:iron complex outermembrane recepter protein